MAVNIEHEDTELDRIEGLRLAAENLQAARRRPGSEPLPADSPHRLATTGGSGLTGPYRPRPAYQPVRVRSKLYREAR